MEIKQIEILRSTVASGKIVEKGKVLTVPDDVSALDAHRLIALGKASEHESDEDVPEPEPGKADD